MVETLPHWFLSDICDRRWWSLLLLPLVHNKGLAPGEEGETTPTTTVGLLCPLSYMVYTLPHWFFNLRWWSLDRLKVNPKCHLIIFLENPSHSIFPTYPITSHCQNSRKNPAWPLLKKDISSTWNLPERKLINTLAKHRPLGGVPCKYRPLGQAHVLFEKH